MKQYEEYQHTNIRWTPSIPSHWELMRGKAFFYNKKELNKGNICTNILSLTLKGVINNNGNRPIGLSPQDYSTYQIFDEGNLVFKLIDLENISTSRVGLVHEHGIMSSAYIRLISRYDCNMRYFYFQYYEQYLRNVYNGLGAGVRSTLNATDLLNLTIFVPPRPEQDQIVRFLDWKVSSINKLISVKRKQIKVLEEQEKKIISDSVLHGLKNSKLKDSGNRWLGDIPMEWNVIKLGRFCSFQNGISESGDFFTSGTPFVGYGDVYRHLELPETVSGVARSNEQQQEAFSVRKGDIFFTRTSENIEEVGMAAVCKHTIEKAVFSGFVIRCRPRMTIVDIDYMKYYLQIPAIRNHFSSMMNIVIRASLGQNLLKQMPVVIPPMAEQKEIATYLEVQHEKYVKLIKTLKKEIEVLNEFKTRLISDVVTGKIDVRNIEIPDYEYVANEADTDIDEDANTEDTDEQEE